MGTDASYKRYRARQAENKKKAQLSGTEYDRKEAVIASKKAE